MEEFVHDPFLFEKKIAFSVFIVCVSVGCVCLCVCVQVCVHVQPTQYLCRRSQDNL